MNKKLPPIKAGVFFAVYTIERKIIMLRVGKELKLNELNQLKVAARKIGKTSEDYLLDLQKFWNINKLYMVTAWGHLWEIAVCFILGVFQTSMNDRGIKFYVYTDVSLDRRQIDISINRHAIQLKFGWPDDEIELIQDELANRNITVINAPAPDGYGTDIFREILAAAGFSEEEIEVEIDENPGFDAAEEVYEWFKKIP
jgi:hypothetical protein